MATKMRRSGKNQTRLRAKRKVANSRVVKTRRKVTTTRKKNIKISVPSSLVNLPSEAIRKQLLSYSDQIESYLRKINAKVDSFTFDVTNFDQGLTINCKLKATIAE